LFIAVAVLAAACTTGSPETGGSFETAERIHNQGNTEGAVPCSACHSLDGTQLVGPTFQGIATAAAERQEGVSAEAYLRASITMPASYVVPGYSNAMPATYTESLSEAEIDALVDWLLTFDEVQ
ncbi:MAG: c-type cytochrome, partial [Anaerolineae bacterium]